MAEFIVEQTATGVVLFQGEAASPADALDAMARDAGYANFVSMPQEVGGNEGLVVLDNHDNRYSISDLIDTDHRPKNQANPHSKP